jgi:hypothetical protein
MPPFPIFCFSAVVVRRLHLPVGIFVCPQRSFIDRESLKKLVISFINNSTITQDESTPIHELLLTGYGCIFTPVIGLFLSYDVSFREYHD